MILNAILEFRDKERHFNYAGFENEAANYGHEWVTAEGTYFDTCTIANCPNAPTWFRWMVCHHNWADFQCLCSDHALELAKKTPTLQAVLCVRDRNSEFSEIVWEMNVDAEFPWLFPDEKEK